MKITLLGTAAAEAIPALWCECEVCRIAIERGGKDLRRRCSYLVDDDTLVDFGPDLFWQSVAFNVDLRAIRRIIFTHPHSDHLNPLELIWRRPGFSKVSDYVDIIASQPVFDRILWFLGKESGNNDLTENFERLKLRQRLVSAGVPHEVDDIKLLPLAANHATGRGLEPLIYVIERNGKRVLIANDTGWLSEESWAVLQGVRLDAAIIESTSSVKFADARDNHMGAHVTAEFAEKLRTLGCLKAESRTIANHFSHNGCVNHAEMVEAYAALGLEVAYDGMVLEV